MSRNPRYLHVRDADTGVVTNIVGPFPDDWHWERVKPYGERVFPDAAGRLSHSSKTLAEGLAKGYGITICPPILDHDQVAVVYTRRSVFGEQADYLVGPGVPDESHSWSRSALRKRAYEMFPNATVRYADFVYAKRKHPDAKIMHVNLTTQEDTVNPADIGPSRKIAYHVFRISSAGAFVHKCATYKDNPIQEAIDTGAITHEGFYVVRPENGQSGANVLHNAEFYRVTEDDKKCECCGHELPGTNLTYEFGHGIEEWIGK